ncbi:MAG: MltA domain-containing protein [Arenicellales bacterium]|jgi:membrane-bound lytic murein transglycosylase A
MHNKLRQTILLLLLLSLFLGSCSVAPPKPGIGKTVDWQDLPGWQQDKHAEAWPALLQQCEIMPKKKPQWKKICLDAVLFGEIDNESARRFFETRFTAHQIIPSNKKDGSRGNGLVTGYYEPLLKGSLAPDDQYQYPLYARPEDLLRIDLAEVYPELSKMRLRGRVVGNKVVAYHDRKAIDREDSPLTGKELVWIDDPVAVFFLHVQGSGRIQLKDGSMMAVGYADQNGQPYSSIGKILIERGEIEREDISLFTIRKWLQQNPEQAQALLEENRSYVFFQMRQNAKENPRGSLNIPLTPSRSIAVDPSNIPLGSPVWLDTSYPGEPDHTLQRLTFAQDTGGAIKGYARADMFWGNGEMAEKLAGEMKQQARLYVLMPLDETDQVRK